MAEAVGFGRVCDIREIETGDGEARSIAAYLTKGGISETASGLAAYLTKTSAQAAGEMREKLGERLQPVAVSRGFLGGRLSDVEAEISRHFAEQHEEGVPEVWELWRESDAIAVSTRCSRRRERSSEKAAERSGEGRRARTLTNATNRDENRTADRVPELRPVHVKNREHSNESPEPRSQEGPDGSAGETEITRKAA